MKQNRQIVLLADTNSWASGTQALPTTLQKDGRVDQKRLDNFKRLVTSIDLKIEDASDKIGQVDAQAQRWEQGYYDIAFRFYSLISLDALQDVCFNLYYPSAAGDVFQGCTPIVWKLNDYTQVIIQRGSVLSNSPFQINIQIVSDLVFRPRALYTFNKNEKFAYLLKIIQHEIAPQNGDWTSTNNLYGNVIPLRKADITTFADVEF